MNKSITIVTAFFDIGRGNWNTQNGYSDRLERTVDTYFSYFTQLAKLNNEIVVFTSPDLKEEILKIRKGKPTHVITINLSNKFKHIIKKISTLQHSESFKKLIKPEQLKNPEYWSAEYVLINNLKPFFVNRAINMGLTNSKLFAWVDFGYVRNEKTLYGINTWYHPFDKDKVHFFTIKDTLDLSNEKAVLHAVLNNDPHIIGGVLVASREKWPEFYKLVSKTQKDFIKSGIIDDDQGIFLTCASRNAHLFQLNFLGRMKWFRTFRLFHKGSKINYLTRLGILLRIIK
ncbi:MULTISPECIES: protein YibB [Providencia]|uniref:protein YibB n=1 Tax=Providencia TaxID=586 RepID=UPI0015D542C2|nr:MULTISPECIES: protein YibB [Providencia]MDH2377289.1 protein YibB [Providencia rettgeri]QLI99210.1 protein YibB [Providencia rettgeri]